MKNKYDSDYKKQDKTRQDKDGLKKGKFSIDYT